MYGEPSRPPTIDRMKRVQHHDLDCSTGSERFIRDEFTSSRHLNVMVSQNKDEIEMNSGMRYNFISESRTSCGGLPADSIDINRANKLLCVSSFEGGAIPYSQMCFPHKRRKSRYMHSLSTSHLPVLSPRWLVLACSSILIFLSSITHHVSASSVDVETDDRKFLRSSGKDKKENSSRQHLSSPYDEADQKEDYETLHARLNIPLPAMGASLMGVINDQDDNDVPERGHIFAFAGTGAALQKLADLEADKSTKTQKLSLDGDDESKDQRRKLSFNEDDYSRKTERFFAFAGTNQAMKNLEAQQQDKSPERSRKQTLLANQERTRDKSDVSDSGSNQIDAGFELGTFSSSLYALKSARHSSPMLERSDTDLDRGRYLVGLEVRDIQPHQQILIDYETNDGKSPLRIKYTLSEGAGEINANSLMLLEQLIESSFSAAAEAWSKALRVNPVPNKIYPTVETCGAATIPKSDREDGVDDADVVVYVSGDNRFCGGALLHSAVCDFDQHTRPLVGNINICTINLPKSNILQGTALQDSTLKEYSRYVTTETGRILGASTSLFKYFIDPQTMSRYGSTEKKITCVDGKEEALDVPNIIFEEIYQDGNRSYELRTSRVTEIIRNHFDCMILTGARLEQRSDSIGCFGGFLDDHQFYSEQMTGFEAGSTKGPSISPLTLALLEDSSWYEADYKSSNETSFGRGAGCQFARSGCLFDGRRSELDNDNSAFHCTEIGELGCDVSHSYKAKCDFIDSLSDLSSDTNSFCPMNTRQAVSCTDSSAFLATGGEYYGSSSKCFHTNRGEPMCLRGECNELTRTIDIYYDGQMFSCNKDYEIIDTFRGLQIKCPKIAAVCPTLICPSNCSGRGVCDRDRDGTHSCICDDPFDQSPGCYGEYQLDEL